MHKRRIKFGKICIRLNKQQRRRWSFNSFFLFNSWWGSKLGDSRHIEGVLHFTQTPAALQAAAYAATLEQKHSQSPPLSQEHVSLLHAWKYSSKSTFSIEEIMNSLFFLAKGSTSQTSTKLLSGVLAFGWQAAKTLLLMILHRFVAHAFLRGCSSQPSFFRTASGQLGGTFQVFAKSKALGTTSLFLEVKSFLIDPS